MALLACKPDTLTGLARISHARFLERVRYVFPHFQNSNRRRDISYDDSHTNRDAFVGQAAEVVQNEFDRYQARKKDTAVE